MRILIQGINFYPEPVGTGKYTGEMAAWLVARGHDVRVVTAPPHYPQWRVPPEYSARNYSRERLSPATVLGGAIPPAVASLGELDVFRCPIWVPRAPGGVRRLLHLASFALSSWPAMLRHISWRPGVVLLIEPTFACSPVSLFVAWWTGAKSWLHVQDLEVDAAFELGDFSSYRARKWAFTLERILLRRFDRVSAISGKMVERLLQKGLDTSRRLLFPNWVDTTVIRPLSCPSPFRRELGIANDTVVALYAGSMGKKQGLDLLVDAARQLFHCTNLRFFFCGEGTYRPILMEKARDLTNITLLPVQPSERLNDLLNLADIHLLPQRAGAADLVMPSKLTGMMASGRPVVATAGPGTQLAQAVRGKGLVTPPGDRDAFASALLQLAVDRDLRLELGREARKCAVADLNRDHILAQFEAALLNTCRESGKLARMSRGEATHVECPHELGAAVRSRR